MTEQKKEQAMPNDLHEALRVVAPRIGGFIYDVREREGLAASNLEAAADD